MEPITLVSRPGAFIYAPPAFLALDNGQHVLCWCEIEARKVYLRVCMIDAERNVFPVDVIALSSTGPTALGLAPLHHGGFALAWNDGFLIRVRRFGSKGNSVDDTLVGKAERQVKKMQVAVLSSGQIAISWIDAMALVQDKKIILSASTPDAWHSTMAIINGDYIVRAVSYNHPEMYGVPIYGIDTSIFDSDGKYLHNYKLNIPPTVIDSTYSHPEDLTACGLSDQKFVIAWTQLAHHLGNHIQAQIFSREGEPLAERMVVASADPTSHVNEAALAELGNSEFLVGWSHSENGGVAFRARSVSTGSENLGPEIAITEDRVENRADTFLFGRLSQKDLIALWTENHDIKLSLLTF